MQRKMNSWLALAAGLALAACSRGPTAPEAVTLTITANDTFRFDPDTFTAKVGQPVNIALHDAGALEHSIIIDELSVNVHVQSGQDAPVSFTPTATGRFTFYCDVPGHKAAGMVGTLVVEP